MEEQKLARLNPTELGVSLTALDIHNKDFDRSFRGYNEDQVNEFFDLIINDYETYNNIIKGLQEQISHLNRGNVNNLNFQEDILQRIRELETYCWGRSKG